MAAYNDPQDVDDWAESLSAAEVDDLEGLGRATLDARCLALEEIGRATDTEDRAYFAAPIDERRAALAVAADVPRPAGRVTRWRTRSRRPTRSCGICC